MNSYHPTQTSQDQNGSSVIVVVERALTAEMISSAVNDIRHYLDSTCAEIGLRYGVKLDELVLSKGKQILFRHLFLSDFLQTKT